MKSIRFFLEPISVDLAVELESNFNSHMKTKDKMKDETQGKGLIRTFHKTALHTKKHHARNQEHELTIVEVTLPTDILSNDKKLNDVSCHIRNEYLMKYHQSLCDWYLTTVCDRCFYK